MKVVVGKPPQPVAGGEQLVELLDATFDWSMRHQLVTRQQLGQKEASAVVRRIVLAVLAPDGPLLQ